MRRWSGERAIPTGGDRAPASRGRDGRLRHKQLRHQPQSGQTAGLPGDTSDTEAGGTRRHFRRGDTRSIAHGGGACLLSHGGAGDDVPRTVPGRRRLRGYSVEIEGGEQGGYKSVVARIGRGGICSECRDNRKKVRT